MTKVSSQDLGHQPIGKLLLKQAVPASIGILVRNALKPFPMQKNIMIGVKCSMSWAKISMP